MAVPGEIDGFGSDAEFELWLRVLAAAEREVEPPPPLPAQDPALKRFRKRLRAQRRRERMARVTAALRLDRRGGAGGQ